ncbi:MAG: glycosyltransferase [Caulobacter sp.]|jgi:cellulose synthase/poly-beta-1,6-N-acetylglucosamine synthase-like glycosyltransferase|nr:glycosyltransferase [Caulobacter sp.]
MADIQELQRSSGTRRIVRRPAPRLAGEADALAHRGAALPPNRAQWATTAALIGGPLIAAVLWPATTWAVAHAAFFVLFAVAALTRLAAALTPRVGVAAPALKGNRLPRYTVICPLYQEAAVAPQLVAALDALDYPRHRLQALVVVEADDAETRAALEAMPLPGFIEVLVAPPGVPRTKPRACNIALGRATGELVTIYDAEDRPHPAQLREAASRFVSGPPRLACLQAPLRIEPDRRFLPRQFALEYAIQFEVVLPMLARLGLPFPLGGTSNHFRRSALDAVGGWDPWNVTEDADLGFRLAAEGYELGVLESPTFEAAPDSLTDWLPQRARWVKGYMQTFGVQTRSPPHWRTHVMTAFALTLGVAIAAAFLHGPLLALTLAGGLLGVLSGEAWLRPADMGLLLAGWSCAATAAVVGMRRAGLHVRPRDLLLTPLYWPLQSLAAVHALIQLLARPHHWDKTRHRPLNLAESGQNAG